MAIYTLLRSFVGGKASYCNEIKPFFDKNCKNYYEIFAGSLAVFFSMFNGQFEREYINDLSIDLAVLYLALTKESTRAETVERILSLRKLNDPEKARENFKIVGKNMKGTGPMNLDQIKDAELVGIAANTFLAYSQSFNSSSKGYSKYKSDEHYRRDVKENIMNASPRLNSNVTVTCADGLEILQRDYIINNPENQLFLDPPYCGICRSNNAPTDYKTDMVSLENHIKLCESIRDAKAAVVLCGYRLDDIGVSSAYDAFLGKDWGCYLIGESYKKCEVIKKNEKKSKAKEYIWTNRKPSELAKYYVSLKNYNQGISREEYWEKITRAIMTKEIIFEHAREYYNTYKNLYARELVTIDYIKRLKRKGE